MEMCDVTNNRKKLHTSIFSIITFDITCNRHTFPSIMSARYIILFKPLNRIIPIT